MATQCVPFALAPRLACSQFHSFTSSDAEDWDRSMNLDTRNSVAFPADDAGAGEEPGQGEGAGRDKRTISELLKLHAEKGKDVTFSAEEAGRIAEVLGQWVSRVLSWSCFLIWAATVGLFLLYSPSRF